MNHLLQNLAANISAMAKVEIQAIEYTNISIQFKNDDISPIPVDEFAVFEQI